MTTPLNDVHLIERGGDLPFILSHLVQGISLIDEQGCFAYINEAYAEPMGYNVEEMIGKNWAITILPEDLKLVLDARIRMIKEGRAEAEVRGKRKNGSIFWKHLVLIQPESRIDGFRGHYCFMTDISQRKYMEAKLRDLAIKDDLTSLYNRRGFIQMAETYMLDRTKRLSQMKLFMFDMDGLKRINDEHGHLQGDRALKAFAQVLVTGFHPDDLIGRLGGDEFVVLSIDPANAEAIRCRLLEKRDELAKSMPDELWHVEFSLGHVNIPPDSFDSIESLLDRADTFMYMHKAERRSQRRS